MLLIASCIESRPVSIGPSHKHIYTIISNLVRMSFYSFIKKYFFY